MSSRYDSTSVSKRKDGKRFMLTTIYPAISKRYDDIFIYAKETDRLDTLALQFYSDPNLWWIIGQINKLGKGSLEIPPGMQLRIPRDITQILLNFKLANG